MKKQTISSAAPVIRHIACISGGKDSTALAIYMRDRVPELEYVFSDTGKELPETYEYLHRLEAFIGKSIVYLNAERDFDHYLQMYNNYLPSSRSRWCTRMLRIRPLERYIGDAPTLMYVGIRADEDRDGYISTKPNISPVFPFKQDGIGRDDVIRMLDEAGLGLPDYYKWRTRSGCYFCFFQRKSEWVGLLHEHPELFELAKAYEKTDSETGKTFTWNDDESLEELSQPARILDILRKKAEAVKSAQKRYPGMRLLQILSDVNDAEDREPPCTICQL